MKKREYLLTQNKDHELKKDNFYNLFLNDNFKKKKYLYKSTSNTKDIILSLKTKMYQ